jgi:DNA-binding LacI/PurR family transcriptional regulator
VIAYGESTAEGLIEHLRGLGLRTPQDISVTSAAGPWRPPGSGVRVATNRVPFIEMGRQAVRTLEKRCKGVRPRTQKIERIAAEYTEGETVAPPAKS